MFVSVEKRIEKSNGKVSFFLPIEFKISSVSTIGKTIFSYLSLISCVSNIRFLGKPFKRSE